MSLGELQSALFRIYQSIPEQNCAEQLSVLAQSQNGYIGYVASWFAPAQNDQSLANYLKKVEKLFQDNVQALLPVLKSYETFLKQISEENIVDPRDFQSTARKLDAFYHAVHPFLILLQKHKKGLLPEIDTKNIKQLFSHLEDQTLVPFQFKQQPLLCRMRAIMALEGFYLGPLPYAFLKTVSRNYVVLWQKNPEDNRYHDGLVGFIKQINVYSTDTNWIRVVIKGLRALVDHFQAYHHIEGTAKASLPGLLMAFYMTSEKSAPNKRNWLQTRDTHLIEWRKGLKKGMKLFLNTQEIILGNRIKRKKILLQKKEDKNRLYDCENLAEKVVIIPPNQALLFLLPLFPNTGIPLYEFYDVDFKGRFALIERLYPLNHALKLFPLSDDNQHEHPIIKAFDGVIKDNEQPSNFDEELLMVDKTGQFKAIGSGEMIALDREVLEKVVLALVNNNLEQYKLFIFESNKMRPLHFLCTHVMRQTLGFIKDDLEEIVFTRRLLSLQECEEFCEKVKKLKADVHHELLKTFDQDTLNLNDRTISSIILDTFYYLRAGPDLNRVLSFVCSKFIELSKKSLTPHIIFQFEATY